MSGQYTQGRQRGQRMARALPGYTLTQENGLTIFPAKDRVLFAMCFVTLGEVSESAEGARLLSEYTGLNLYRGFKSLPLRQQETRQLVIPTAFFRIFRRTPEQRLAPPTRRSPAGLEHFPFETRCVSNHTACRFVEKTRFFRLLWAGRSCAAASRFTFFKDKTL